MGKVKIPPTTLLYPAPVLLVTCKGKKGQPNIITVSWAGILCSDPPLVGISIQPTKYSHGLIKESKQFVINIPTDAILWATDYCGNVSGKDEDKFTKTGLTPLPGEKVMSPLIKECPVNLECDVMQVISLGTHDLFIGKVVVLHVDEEALLPGLEEAKDLIFRETIDIDRCRPIVYIPGGGKYWNLKERLAKVLYTKAPSPDSNRKE